MAVTEIKREAENELLHREHHRKIVWMHFTVFFLGLWLMTSPIQFTYRDRYMIISDLICGFMIALSGLLSVNPSRLWAPWVSVMFGMWLCLAPLIFWTPEAVVYHNNIVIGVLVIVFALIAPGVPGIKLYEQKGPDIPPGWSVNPSSWMQRAPIITLGWIGFFASRYLASYQLGYIDAAWDPFFGKGTENVLNSDVSKAWPVSDAGLGAFSYMLDVLMGYLGGENRWRTMPWAVIFFGILIIPLGAISITLIILQPLSVGDWCSVCLLTACVMLIMIPCSFDEVFASIGMLIDNKKKGISVWKTFWKGGTMEGSVMKYQSHDFTAGLSSTVRDIFRDLNIPWNLIASVAIGIWLMFAPALLGYENSIADSDHVMGALVITFSVIAIGEIVRTLRFLNIITGLWIMLAPFILGGTSAAMINGVGCGLLLVILSLRKGKTVNSYGVFDKYVF